MSNNVKLIDSKYNVSGLTIKPGLNLEWYKNEDRYSDGDIEDVIINHIIENEPEDYSKVIYDHLTWPTYYHLTHVRKNLLNWYPFSKNDSVLEIGCGMGALTGLLCDKCGKVTAVELSKRRATATLVRCRDKSNLEVIVGNLNDIKFEEKFDYITLIGVLEYQGKYTDSEHPYKDFLKKVGDLLKPGGKLLVAIENQYGAKYWCGAHEDHTGLPFDGLNQYLTGNGNARTFSKMELKELMNASGYGQTYFYYPFPDYKLPTVIYSEAYLPKSGGMQNVLPVYVPNSNSIIINERGLYDDFIKNGVFEFFSNSFLVECMAEKVEGERVVFASLGSLRKKDYRIGTTISSDENVKKFFLEKGAENSNHLKQTMGNSMSISARGLKSVLTIMDNNELLIQFMNAPTMEDKLMEKYKERDLSSVLKIYSSWLKEIEQSSGQLPADENIMYELEIDDRQDEKDYGVILSIGYLDMIPRNCFVKDNENWWYDQEWKLDKIPAKYIFQRGLSEMYDSYPWMEEIYPIHQIAEEYGLLSLWKTFDQLSKMFMYTVLDSHHLGCAGAFWGCNMNKIKEHVNKLMKD